VRAIPVLRNPSFFGNEHFDTLGFFPVTIKIHPYDVAEQDGMGGLKEKRKKDFQRARSQPLQVTINTIAC
jgi:hypothetical protein